MTVHQWSNTTEDPIYTRDAPCSCGGGDCPDCTSWINLEGDATYPILAAEIGNCYSRTKNNIAILLPLVATIRTGFCVTVRNTALPDGDVYIRPTPPDTTKFLVNDVLYDYITVNHGGTVCVCYNGTRFVVTGNASGWDDGPG
jgi:hypothetical protein